MFPVNSFLFQVDLVREVEAPSPQPEEAEEPMETSQPEPSDLQEPANDVQDDVAAPEAGSGSEAAE